jgi:hypothetical protein
MAYRQDTTSPTTAARQAHDARAGAFAPGPYESFASLAEAIAIAAYPAPPTGRRHGWDRVDALACLGVFLLIFASKLLLIHFASSQIPFSDEWDAEAAGAIRPFLEGQFGVRNLFDHDNEHLIVFTRLLTILGLEISGYWDVVLPMILNAFLHSATLALLLAALARTLDGGKAMVAIFVGCAFGILPFGHENTLLGFNTHFYTLMAFSFGALWLFADAEAWSPRWGLGVLLATGAFLSMASGALAPVAAAVVALAQIWRGARTGFREWLGIAALLALGGLFIALTPHIPENDVFRAQSVPAFLSGLVDLLAWPVNAKIGALLYIPGLAFAFAVLRDAPRRNDPRWFNLGVLAWTLSQLSALAFGRSEMLISRYFDFCVIGVYANCVSALWLAPKWSRLDRRRNFAFLGLALATILAAILMINHGRAIQFNAILERHDSAGIQEARLRSYVANGDLSALAAKGPHDLPYPSASRLKALLDDPIIRATLPPGVNPDQHVRPMVETAKAGVLGLWWACFAAGLLCMMISVWKSPRQCGGLRRAAHETATSLSEIQ